MTNLAVIGAAGDVGRGVVAAAVDRGWTVTAVGRDPGRLAAYVAEFDGAVDPLLGALDDDAAQRLATDLAARSVQVAVVAVNTPVPKRRLTEWSTSDLLRRVEANLAPHHLAARMILPVLPADGLLLGIGGGTADFVMRGAAPLSLVQSAQRMLYRALAAERRPGDAMVREVLIASMVNGRSTAHSAPADWLTDREIGEFVCDLIASGDEAGEPVVSLRPSRPSL